MSEIVTVSLGGCGVNVGLSFWDEFYRSKAEAKIRESRCHYHRIQEENMKGQRIPRAVFIDSDIKSNYRVFQSQIKFDPRSVVGYGTSCSNLYVEGNYLCNQEFEIAKDALRRQVQICDLFSGFITIKSTLGGAGSGLGENIAVHIRQNYSMNNNEEVKIFPGFSKEINSRYLHPLEIYNIGLSNHTTIQCSDLVSIYENNAVERILQKRKKPDTKKTGRIKGFGEINKYIGNCLNEHVSPYIYSGELNLSQRKRAVNLILYPRIKHVCGSLSQQGDSDHIASALNSHNRVMNFSSNQRSNIFAMNVNVRDSNQSENSVHAYIAKWANKHNNFFGYESPNMINLSLGKASQPGQESSWILLNQNTNIQSFRQISELYHKAFRRKAYIWHYTSRGMDEMEFTEAGSNLADFISEYRVNLPEVDPDDYDYEESRQQ